MIAWVIGMSAAIIICSLHYMINERPYEREPLEPTEPFIVSEYYDRMEKAALDILEHREAVEQTIILWWGLDGLRLNEDGELEWVSRRKPKPIDAGAFRSCAQYMPTPQYDMYQSTRAQIDALMAQNMQLQVQAWQIEQNRRMVMVNVLQSYVVHVQWPGYYATLTDCCCNQTRDRF